MRSPWRRVGHDLMISVFRRRGRDTGGCLWTWNDAASGLRWGSPPSGSKRTLPGSLEGARPCQPLILGLWPPEWERRNSCCSKPPCGQCFAMTVPEDWHTRAKCYNIKWSFQFCVIYQFYPFHKIPCFCTWNSLGWSERKPSWQLGPTGAPLRLSCWQLTPRCSLRLRSPPHPVLHEGKPSLSGVLTAVRLPSREWHLTAVVALWLGPLSYKGIFRCSTSE